MQKVLVLGAGSGGIVAAGILKRVITPGTHLLVVDRRGKHHFPSSFPLLMINERKPADITRSFSHSFKKRGIDFLQALVEEIDLKKRRVITDRGTLSCDYLVISLGVDYHPETVPGFNEYAYNIYEYEDVVRVSKILPGFEKGNIVLFISSLPFKCPPAPYEMMFLLDQFFRQKGNRNQVKLTVVTPEPTPEPLAGPLVGQSIRQMLTERGIELQTGAKVLALEPGTLILDHGIRVPGDLFLGIAPHWGPEVLRRTDLVNPDGWAEVDQHTLQTRYQGVYVIGDAAGVKLPVMGVYAPKAGIFAHYQAEVVARNIGRQLQGLSPTFRFTGKGA